jgi:hypothetical protein
MSVHIHTARHWCASAFLLVPAPLLLGWAMAPGSTEPELAQVSGQVTCADHPVTGTIYFISDQGGAAHAVGSMRPDGSFQLYMYGILDRRGAVPGTYRVVVRPRVPDRTGSCVDSKYQDARTTDLLVPVGPDWNYVRLSLH